jgi:uncharacterized membrane protein YhiD involved in acid resistance
MTSNPTSATTMKLPLPTKVVSRTPSSMTSGTQRQHGDTQKGSDPSSKSVEDLDIGRGSCFDIILMSVIWTFFIIFGLVVTLGEWLLLPRDRLDWCHAARMETDTTSTVVQAYPNPDANTDPCYYERTVYLMGWNQFECDFARRMIFATILGACIGFERKSQDRPAGLRTMSLVSLGSAIFTLGGQFAFRSSTQTWDAARVSAAIPSGVGFLGGALIWKETTGEKGPNQRNHVHGITTAASVWLSASVSIAAGGALWVCSTWTFILVVFVLRFGPTMAFVEDESYRTSDESLSSDEDGEDWPDECGGDEIAVDESLKTFETSRHKSLHASEVAFDSLRQRSSAADMKSIRQIERQQVNFHSD